MRKALLSATILALSSAATAHAQSAATQCLATGGASAPTAANFGVNTHLNEAAYGNVQTVLSALNYLGVTHIRDNLSGLTANPAPYAAVANAGIKLDLVVPGNTDISTIISQLNAFETAHPGSISAIEGPNEINLNPVTYNGQIGYTAAEQFQTALYQAVHADPTLGGIPVYDLTSPGAETNNAGLPSIAGTADAANIHVYTDTPSQELAAQYGTTWAEGYSGYSSSQLASLPKVITETGSSTGNVSQAQQATDVQNTVSAATAGGYAMTYFYELLDDPSMGTAQEQNYGLFHADGTPKLAATALKKMLGCGGPIASAPAAVATTPTASEQSASTPVATTATTAAATPIAGTPAFATTTQPSTGQITPGRGSVTDCNGNVWTIDPYGNVMEGQTYIPGGGGTSALSIQGCTVYGQDNGHDGNTVNPGGWFTLNGQDWLPSAPPGGPAGTTGTAGSVTTAPATAPPPIKTSLPPATSACTTGAVPTYAATAGGFGTINGQVYSPNGTPFVARGFNVDQTDMASAMQSLLTDFPQTNFIRLNVDTYAPPSFYAPFINYFTSRGVVVELEDHIASDGSTNGGGAGTVFSPAQQATESAWYASVAAANASNPYVWFGTDNEPSETAASGNPDPPALSAWQENTYNAIRGAGNTAPILLEQYGGGVPGQIGAPGGMVKADYANMTNIIQDIHFYGWPSNYSTDQGTVNSTLAGMISAAHTITGANGTPPVIIGEYGNSTSADGALDANWQQVVSAVTNTANGTSGAAVWSWNSGFSADQVVNSGGSLTALGQKVSAFIAGSSAQGCAQSPIPNPVVQSETAPPLAAASITQTAPTLAPVATTQTAPPLPSNPLSVSEVAALAVAGR